MTVPSTNVYLVTYFTKQTSNGQQALYVGSTQYQVTNQKGAGDPNAAILYVTSGQTVSVYGIGLVRLDDG